MFQKKENQIVNIIVERMFLITSTTNYQVIFDRVLINGVQINQKFYSVCELPLLCGGVMLHESVGRVDPSGFYDTRF